MSSEETKQAEQRCKLVQEEVTRLEEDNAKMEQRCADKISEYNHMVNDLQ